MSPTRTHTHRAPPLTSSPSIHAHAQTAIALLPNIAVDPLPTALFEVTNDAHLGMYVASLGRAVVALHELLQNKRKFKDVEAGGEGD